MLKAYSNNAILAKARAMYGKTLKTADYDELLRAQNVTSVAEYLKQNTHYSDTLEGIDVGTIHRGQLEALLRRDLFDEYIRLVRYDFSPQGGFYEYLVVQSEIQQILIVLRLLNFDSPSSYILTLPGYLQKHASFNLNRLAEVKGFDDLLAVLQHTPYYPILKKLRPQDGQQIDLMVCESSLTTYYYQFIFKTIDKAFTGRSAQQLIALFLSEVDALNLAFAYRLKRFFKCDNGYIRSCLLPFKTQSAKIIEEIISAASVEDINLAVAKCRFSGDFAESDLGYIEFITQKNRFYISRRGLHFAPSPPVVLVSYMVQLSIELDNIVNIIEGIRYGLSPDEIQRLLLV